MKILLTLAGAALLVVAGRELAKRSNTQVHRINQP